MSNHFPLSARQSPGSGHSGTVTVQTEYVYFVQAESGGPIKIGVAMGLGSRLRGLQHMCPVPLRCLATLPGYTELERRLHERFSEHRLHGEWFEPAPELLAFIATIPGGEVTMPDVRSRRRVSSYGSRIQREVERLTAWQRKLYSQIDALKQAAHEARERMLDCQREAITLSGEIYALRAERAELLSEVNSLRDEKRRLTRSRTPRSANSRRLTEW